jgi:Proteasome subunit
MTLAIAALTSEGIVLTADSRQTYKNLADTVRVGTDNSTKIFQLGEKIAVAIAGRAFALDDHQRMKNIGWFIEQFRKHELKQANTTSVKAIAQQLNKSLTDKQIDNVGLIVAGYDPDAIGHAQMLTVGQPLEDGLSRNTQDCGYLRIGQDDVVARIMHGWSHEISDLDFVKKAQNDGVNIAAELNKLHYIVNWGTIPIQDAVDFCILMTRITESVQRFSDGTTLHPGSIPGVGGEIDVATITSEGFQWLKQKTLAGDKSWS